MKRVIILVIIILGFRSFMTAQEYVNEFGKISKADVDLKTYDPDTNADAVVIYDMGKSWFSRVADNFEVIYERTTRIKILKESGEKWADIEIPFYEEGNIYEQVYDVEAYTCNFEDGQLVKSKFDYKNARTVKVNDYWNNKKIAMPNVRAGSIIEYRYKIRSQFLFQFRDWEFQWKIPVIYSKYEVDLIPFYQYSWILQGASKFDSQRSYESTGLSRQYGSATFKDMVHEYVMRDIPAFKDEGFISSLNDYLIKIDFQLCKIIQPNGSSQDIQTTWQELIKDMLRSDEFGVYVSNSQKAALKLLNIQEISQKTPAEKFDSIINYVKMNYRWNGENGKYTSQKLKNFLKDKTGNSADINLFTVGLLNACGIKASPVLISTRDHGKIKYNYPFNHFFNYVIIKAEVDGKIVSTDATDPLLANNRIPVKCINDQGLIIQKDKVEWVQLQTFVPSKQKVVILQHVTDSLQQAVIDMSATEYLSYHFRKEYDGDVSNVQKKIINSKYNLVDSIIALKSETNSSKLFSLKYKVSGVPETINSKIYVSPFLNEVMNDNPLKQPTRLYPIDMIYPEFRMFYSEVTIPDNYVVDFKPENDKINNDSFQLEYLITPVDNKICISFNYYFKKPVYPAEEYDKIKYYFKEIVKLGAQKIVLKRK